MPRRSLTQVLQSEFAHYTPVKFRQDVLAGINVAAVALPLALAFGVASGATAAAGLVSAIIAGVVMGALSGAPYQISGPTGAMSAVLVLLIRQYGLQGMWLASLMSAVLLFFIGLLGLGRYAAFIPKSVVTGFTSGIAVVIAIGQLDNLLGVRTAAAVPAQRLLGYFAGGLAPDWRTLALGGFVMAWMVFWPPRLNAVAPASLLGLVTATALHTLMGWDTPTVGAMPATLVLTPRFTPGGVGWEQLLTFWPSVLSMTALTTIVTLLCGASASDVTGIRLAANQELIAQGVGNLVIPFFGGVPATGAVARTLVGIRSGGQTRVVSLVHAGVLLGCLLLLAPLLAQVPLAALAGMLLVTCWRMNDWASIRYMFGRRFKTASLTFLITVLATTIFDLTQTVLIGVFLSGLAFLNQSANLDVEVQEVDPEKLRQRGILNAGACRHVRVAYLTGPLFFAAVGNFNEAFANLANTHALILSMRGVPLIDTSGLQTITQLLRRLTAQGSTLMISGAHPQVIQMFDRGGLTDAIGRENFFWSADQAIVAAEQRGCSHCLAERQALAAAAPPTT